MIFGRQISAFLSIIAIFTSFEASAGYSSAPYKRPKNDCSVINSQFLKGLDSCRYPSVVQAWDEDCGVAADPASYKNPMTALKLAYLRIMFDREAMMLSRLTPVVTYQKNWDAFEKKWRTRLAGLPDMMGLDESPLLKKEERGGLHLRLASIENLRQQALRQDETHLRLFNGRVRPTSFFVMIAAMLLRADDTDWAKKKFQFDVAFSKGLADRKLTQERDFLYTLFPELVDSPSLFMIANPFQVKHRLSDDDIAQQAILIGKNETIAPFNIRYERWMQKVDKLLASDPNAEAYLANTEKAFLWSMEQLQSKLEADFEIVDKNPEILMRDGLVTLAAITSLDSNFIPQSIERIQVGQCMSIYHDRKWRDITELNEKYGGYLLNGFMAALIVGGGVEIVAGSEVVLRVVGESWVRTMVGGAARVGHAAFETAGIGMLIAGPPWAVETMVYHWNRHEQLVHQFYQTLALGPNSDLKLGAIGASTLSDHDSDFMWSIGMSIWNLAPLAFIF